MPSATPPRPVLPVSWTEVLEQIQQGLEHVLAATAAREQAARTPPADEGAAAIDQALRERWQQHEEKLAAQVQQAEQNAAEVTALLDSGAQAAAHWQDAASAARRRLADWAGGSV